MSSIISLLQLGIFFIIIIMFGLIIIYCISMAKKIGTSNESNNTNERIEDDNDPIRKM